MSLIKGCFQTFCERKTIILFIFNNPNKLWYVVKQKSYFTFKEIIDSIETLADYEGNLNIFSENLVGASKVLVSLDR